MKLTKTQLVSATVAAGGGPGWLMAVFAFWEFSKLCCRRLFGMIGILLRPFSLRIFGSSLLDSSGERVILWRTIIITLTASVDCIAWAETGREVAAVPGMIVLGVIAFLLVYVADAAYLTHDSSSEETARLLAGRAPAGTRRFKKAWMALGARVTIAIATTVISGPSLVALVMATDVDNVIQAHAMQSRSGARTELLKPKTDEIAKLTARIEELNGQINEQIRGVNARIGCGTICKGLKQQQSELLLKRSGLQSEVDAAGREFDAGSAKLIENHVRSAGPAERGDALHELENTPGYRAKRLTIAGLIWILLAVMLMQKALEPAELRLYYSRECQAFWSILKDWVSPRIRPIVFFDLLKRGWSKLAKQITQLDELKPRCEAAHLRQNQVARERTEAETRVKTLRTTVSAAEEGIAVARKSVESLDLPHNPELSGVLQNCIKQVDEAKRTRREAAGELPAAEQRLAELDRALQTAAAEAERLAKEEKLLNERISLTRESVDQSTAIEWLDVAGGPARLFRDPGHQAVQ